MQAIHLVYKITKFNKWLKRRSNITNIILSELPRKFVDLLILA